MAVVPKVIPEVRPQAGPTVFQNVPTTGAEFGVRGAQQTQAFGKTLQAEGEKFFKQEEAARKRQKQRQRRGDAISRAEGFTAYQTKAEQEFRSTEGQEDFSKDRTQTGFGIRLRAIRDEIIASHPGSPESLAILTKRLTEEEGKIVAKSVKKAVEIEDDKLNRVAATHINEATGIVSDDPTQLFPQIGIVLGKINQDAIDRGEIKERELNRSATTRLAEVAISTHIARKDYKEARAVLQDSEISPAFTSDQKTALLNNITKAEAAFLKARADTKPTFITGADGQKITEERFEALSKEQQDEFLGFGATTKFATPEQLKAANLPPDTGAQIDKDGNLKIFKPSPTTIEAKSRATARGDLKAKRTNIESILRAAGASPLALGGAPLFAGEEGKGSASEDTRSVARLMQASRRLLAAGQTALANSLLSQARFVVENSSDIQLQKDLNKPVSRQLAAEMGVPAGTTLGEVASRIPRTPEETAEAVSEARATGKGRVEAKQQLAFIDQATGTIVNMLDAVERDPGIVGARGSLRATGQTAIGVLSDLGASPLIDAARSIALISSDASTEDFEGWFDNPKLSTIKLFENSVGLVLARLRTPQGRVPVEIIKRSIQDVKLSGLTSTEQVENRLQFVLNTLAVRGQGLRRTFSIEEEAIQPETELGTETETQKPTHRIENGKLIRIP